jgi:hypothetical protein
MSCITLYHIDSRVTIHILVQLIVIYTESHTQVQGDLMLGFHVRLFGFLQVSREATYCSFLNMINGSTGLTSFLNCRPGNGTYCSVSNLETILYVTYA